MFRRQPWSRRSPVSCQSRKPLTCAGQGLLQGAGVRVLCSRATHATKQSSESSASRTSALHRNVFQPSCIGSQLCRFGEMSLIQIAWKYQGEIRILKKTRTAAKILFYSTFSLLHKNIKSFFIIWEYILTTLCSKYVFNRCVIRHQANKVFATRPRFNAKTN